MQPARRVLRRRRACFPVRSRGQRPYTWSCSMGVTVAASSSRRGFVCKQLFLNSTHIYVARVDTYVLLPSHTRRCSPSPRLASPAGRRRRHERGNQRPRNHFGRCGSARIFSRRGPRLLSLTRIYHSPTCHHPRVPRDAAERAERAGRNNRCRWFDRYTVLRHWSSASPEQEATRQAQAAPSPRPSPGSNRRVLRRGHRDRQDDPEELQASADST